MCDMEGNCIHEGDSVIWVILEMSENTEQTCN